MELPKEEVRLEEKRLDDTIKLIRGKISVLGQELYDRDDKVLEFKKFMWDNRADMDPSELKTMMSDNDLEISMMMKKGEYLQKLYKIQNNPYFGRIVFSDGINKDNVYIGITHVTDDNNNYYVHDWRSPICNLFYDYEVGKASYMAPMGKIEGEITLKRQYTIKDGKLLHIFDNNTNIDDELLSPSSIAEFVGVSKATLYRKFKEIIDKTPSEFVRGIRLEYAAKLLRTTKLTVSEIMFKCGFSNKSYFYREFLKQYGVSPKDYRNQ